MPDHSTDAKPIAILFDIDSTLLTTGGAGGAAWHVAFEDLFGVDVDIAKYSESGQTDPEVALQCFRGALGREPDHRELTRLINGYLAALPGTVAASSGYRVMPGVRDLLTRLRAADILLGLTTGNVEAAAHIKLERAHLNEFFGFGGYGSDATDRTDLTRRAIERAGLLCGSPIDPVRCDVVGDTPRDVAAAHGAGAIAVGVATGVYSTDELSAAGAEHVLGELTEPFPGV
jgi:beta-phosphoglucomutase-like phosphatase (HAD superfamily)